MAKKQTRRTISFPRALYDAAARHAAALGIPLAQLACEGLRARGVRVETEHRPIEDAARALENRRAAIAERARQREFGDERALAAIREAERSGA